MTDEITLLDPDLFAADLGGLLNASARRCLEEALGAARRGLYLSAVNLIGAVSEAAWYAVGEALRDRDVDLAANLDANQTVQVQQRVASLRSAVRRQRTIATELQAHAAYLRDLRNYGVQVGEPRGRHVFRVRQRCDAGRTAWTTIPQGRRILDEDAADGVLAASLRHADSLLPALAGTVGARSQSTASPSAACPPSC